MLQQHTGRRITRLSSAFITNCYKQKVCAGVMHTSSLWKPFQFPRKIHTRGISTDTCKISV